jgi:hypothetical protein
VSKNKATFGLVENSMQSLNSIIKCGGGFKPGCFKIPLKGATVGELSESSSDDMEINCIDDENNAGVKS